MKTSRVRTVILAGALCAALSAGGCGSNKETEVAAADTTEESAASEKETEQESTAAKESTTAEETTAAAETKQESVAALPETKAAAEQVTFRDLSSLEFWFGSGAGAWSTTLTIHEDGSFFGVYRDSDMGDIGDGYPNGVVYLSVFEGQLAQPEKVNDYTYSMEIQSIRCENEPDTEEILDGILYRYREPNGIEGTKELLLYLPGAPLSELPEEFLSWVGYYNYSETEETQLPFYGLYNQAAQNGFSSYSVSARENMAKYVEETRKQAEVLENSIKSDILSQSELNITSGQLYTYWDEALNSVWSQLKDTLDKESMEALTAEERKWIGEKDKLVEEAGAMYEGGTMEPFARNMKAAELTKERVYELLQLLE